MGRNRGKHQNQATAQIYQLSDFRRNIEEDGFDKKELFDIWEAYCETRYVKNISPIDSVRSLLLSDDSSEYLIAMALEYLTMELMGGMMTNG